MSRSFLSSIFGMFCLVALLSGCDTEKPANVATPRVVPSSTSIQDIGSNQDTTQAKLIATPTPHASATSKPAPTPNLVFTAESLVFSDPMHGWAMGTDSDRAGWSRSSAVAIRATTDGGQTWYRLPAPNASVAELSYWQNAGTVRYLTFANTQDGWAFGPGLFSTHDGGATWRAEQRTGSVVALDSKDSSVWAVESSCHQESGRPHCKFTLMSSDDLGRTWRDIPNQPPTIGTQLQLVRTSKQEAYLYSGGEVDHPQRSPMGIDVYFAGLLVKTSDGGKTWQNLGQPASFPCYTGYLSSPSNDTLWLLCASDKAAGKQEKSALLSQDGGNSWRVVSQTQDQGWSCGIPGAGNLDWVGYVRTFAAQSASHAFLSVDQLGLYVTNDGGHTWNLPYEDPRSGRTGNAESSIIFFDTMHGWFADYNKIARTTDGGVTWTEVEVR